MGKRRPAERRAVVDFAAEQVQNGADSGGWLRPGPRRLGVFLVIIVTASVAAIPLMIYT